MPLDRERVLRTIAALDGLGYTQADIARLVGCSTRALREIIHSFRSASAQLPLSDPETSSGAGTSGASLPLSFRSASASSPNGGALEPSQLTLSPELTPLTADDASPNVGGLGGYELPRASESSPNEIPPRHPEAGSPPKKTKSKKNSRETWISPFWDLWVDRFGGFPSGGEMAATFAPLVELHGSDLVLVAFTRYLDFTPAQFVSLRRFASQCGRWLNNDVTTDSPPEESVDDYIRRMAKE